MKRSIKIMNRKPEITDEEIQAYMNFEKLIAQEKAIAGKRVFRHGTVVLTGLIVVAGLWFYASHTGSEGAQPAAENNPDTPATRAAPVIPEPDSAAMAAQKPVQMEETKTITPRVQKTPHVTGETIRTTPGDKSDADSVAKIHPVYIQAEPIDGYPALYEYFARELTYPAEALKDSVQGVVMVAFTITKNGSAEKITIDQSLGPAFDLEAMRVIGRMPPWQPATHNGQPIASRMSVPLTFQIKRAKTQ